MARVEQQALPPRNRQLNLRSAVPADAAAVAGLSSQLGYPVATQALAARLEALASSQLHAVYVATDRQGRVVGWIHGAEQVLVESGRRCEIMGLVVDATARRDGIGRQLVEAVERWARDRGLPEMSVRSAVSRAESHPFYEQLGYDRVKTQHVYRKRLGNAGDG